MRKKGITDVSPDRKRSLDASDGAGSAADGHGSVKRTRGSGDSTPVAASGSGKTVSPGGAAAYAAKKR